MAAKLGTSAVSLKLGSQSVNAYLGGTLVTPPVGINLYYNAAVDNDWATLGNWWQDASHTVSAAALPTTADSVFIDGYVATNSGAAASVANLQSGADVGAIDISITVSGTATLGSPLNSTGTIVGSATFLDGTYNSGNVTGTATFNGSACNAGGTAGTFVPDPPPACPE